jgi:hypothetical protein
VERRLAHPLKLFEPKTVLEEFFPPEPDCFVSQDRFLSTIGYMPGITLIKSPKGTGKTTVLKQLRSDIEAGRHLSSILKKERPKTILLIGHRRALLREAARKLGLADRLSYERNTLQRALGVDLTYGIIKLNYDNGLISRVGILSTLCRHWASFQNLVGIILSAQDLPLARVPKRRAEVVLAIIAVVAGIADRNGIRRDAQVTASGLSRFSDLCLRNKTMFEDVLGQPLRKDVRTNPIRQLNTFLKLGGLKLEPFLRQKRQKKSIRRYGFEQEKFDLMLSLASAFRTSDSIKKELLEARKMLAERAPDPMLS